MLENTSNMVNYGQIMVCFLLQTLFWGSQVTASSDPGIDLQLSKFNTSLNSIGDELRTLSGKVSGTTRSRVNNMQKELNILLEHEFPDLVNLFDQCEDSQGTTAPPVNVTCYKGMTQKNQTNRRLPFLLWGTIPALCDTHTDGGGWVIIQRRTKFDTDFNKKFEEYSLGFGIETTDFWIGLEIIHKLTLQIVTSDLLVYNSFTKLTKLLDIHVHNLPMSLRVHSVEGFTELRVDMEYDKIRYYANYGYFYVGNRFSRYKLSVGDYSGTAGDSLGYHDDMMFTTIDLDSDLSGSNCASPYYGGWWYNNCFGSALNGLYSSYGPRWTSVQKSYSLTFVEMKVRFVNS